MRIVVLGTGIVGVPARTGRPPAVELERVRRGPRDGRLSSEVIDGLQRDVLTRFRPGRFRSVV
jgi:hypothetical protein